MSPNLDLRSSSQLEVWLSGSVLAQHVQGPGFNPKKKGRKEGREGGRKRGREGGKKENFIIDNIISTFNFLCEIMACVRKDPGPLGTYIGALYF
jgi:hypothetical protein